MKKAKAKPVKGSARTKKFDAGGLAALAGLGTLAYLMSRKKKGEEGGGSGIKASQEFPLTEPSAKDQIASAEIKRAMAASQGRPDLIPEDADEAVMRSDVGLKRTMPAAKKTTSGGGARPVRVPTEGKTSSVGMTGIPLTTPSKAYPLDTKPNEERPSKPYPKGVKGKDTDPYARPSLNLGINERAAAQRAFRERLAAEGKERMDAEEKAKAARRKGVADTEYDTMGNPIMKRGGKVKKYASGGSVSSASKRADGIAQRGKTKGRVC